MKRLIYLSWFILMPVLAETRVVQIEYQGWENSVEISNEQTQLIVVPAIGRIMHYGFRGDDNILWTDSNLYGHTLVGAPKKNQRGNYVWTNFGGDKVWPNEQADFKKINGYSWPPDHWFDGTAQEIKILSDGVVMTSTVSGYNGARIVREIRLASTGSRVSIHQHIEKHRKVSVEPLRYTIWSVTQIVPPQEILYRLNPLSKFDNGYYAFPSGRETATKNFLVEEGGVGIFLPDPVKCQKTGADSDQWLAAIVEDTVIAQFFTLDTTREYPDGGLSAEVFTCPKYTELELLSPLVQLSVGQTLRFSIAWELYRLPAGLQTFEQRRVAALQWLATKTD